MAPGDLSTSRQSRWRRILRFQSDKSVYKPLNPQKQEYRLLLLYAGSGGDPIQAELRPTRFDGKSGPPYETISYRWGDANTVARIQLNKKTVPVPASSAAALRCVRLPDRTRILWIDALCINQSDLDERAQQVAMMADIYSKSTGNLIYLGEVNSFTERAIDSINKIIIDIRERTDNFRSLNGTPFDHGSGNEVSYNDVRINVDEVSLLEFFSNDWFRRVWAFQEAALAPSNICIIGHLHLGLLDILRAARWINYHVSSYLSALRICSGVRCALRLLNFVDREFGFHHVHRKPILDEVLVISCSLLATEPRDHVYGLLGLCNRYPGARNSQLAATLVPDYRKPVGHVFRDAIRTALEQSQNLYLWRFISHLDQTALFYDDSPSWVVDFNRDSDYKCDPERFPQHSFKADDQCVLTSPTISPVDLDLMLLSGLSLDEVVDIAGVLSWRNTAVYENVYSWALNVVWTVRKYVENVTLDDIAMVLLAGRNMEHERATNEDTRHFISILNILSGKHRLPIAVADIRSSTSEQERTMARFWQQMLLMCVHRRVFVTKTGYIGIGPQLTQIGDNVVVLYGGETPYVLRPHRDEYRLVGNCYVQGVMEGEAMRNHKDSGNPDTEFRIR